MSPRKLEAGATFLDPDNNSEGMVSRLFPSRRRDPAGRRGRRAPCQPSGHGPLIRFQINLIPAIITLFLIIPLVTPPAQAFTYSPSVDITLYHIEEGTYQKVANDVLLTYWSEAFTITDNYAAWFVSDSGTEIGIINLSNKESKIINVDEAVISLEMFKSNLTMVNLKEKKILMFNISTSKLDTIVQMGENRWISSFGIRLFNEYLLFSERNEDWEYEKKLLNLDSNTTVSLGPGRLALLYKKTVLVSNYNYSNDITTLNVYDITTDSFTEMVQSNQKVFPVAISERYFIWKYKNGTLEYYNRTANTSYYFFNERSDMYGYSAYDEFLVYNKKEASGEPSDLFLYNLVSKETIRLTDTKNVEEYKSIIQRNYIMWSSYVPLEPPLSSIPGLSLIATIVTLTAVSWTFRFTWKHQNLGRS